MAGVIFFLTKDLVGVFTEPPQQYAATWAQKKV